MPVSALDPEELTEPEDTTSVYDENFTQLPLQLTAYVPLYIPKAWKQGFTPEGFIGISQDNKLRIFAYVQKQPLAMERQGRGYMVANTFMEFAQKPLEIAHHKTYLVQYQAMLVRGTRASIRANKKDDPERLTFMYHIEAKLDFERPLFFIFVAGDYPCDPEHAADLLLMLQAFMDIAELPALPGIDELKPVPGRGEEKEEEDTEPTPVPEADGRTFLGYLQ
jgi:hypothetical protein